MSTLSCAAKRYQIKVLNTPSINIDKKEAKVGDWFDDQSVIVWSKDNQAMRVVSEDNKVYTLSAKLYKESKSKTFADFIVYTKPLAARGTNNPDLIEQLAERFDQDFIMLDEIVIDLSDIPLPENAYFKFHYVIDTSSINILEITIPYDNSIIIKRTDIDFDDSYNGITANYTVYVYLNKDSDPEMITDSFGVELLPM